MCGRRPRCKRNLTFCVLVGCKSCVRPVVAAHDRWPWTRSHRTALQRNEPLGSTEVTHPFHPLRGQRFVVLKIRKVSGTPTLSVRHPDLGSFTLPQEWTDWRRPAEPAGIPLIIDAFGLAALTEIVDLLTSDAKGLD
ncbi:MAG: DUF5372 family protein [Alphaproteobacteria bacterium]